jgi:phosphate transport system substrate-binding protein
MKEMGPTTDFRVSITNSPGKEAYPVSSFTWFLVHKTYTDAAKAKALVQFIWWAETDGQAKASELGYASLPKDLRPWIQSRLKSVMADGSPVM